MPRRLTRRSLVRAAFWTAVALGAGLFATVAARVDRTARRGRQVTIPPDSRDPVSFVEDVIVCRDARGVRAFAARCTHLGCRITRTADGLIVCPCHGSKFRMDGSVAAGPATRPLELLPCRVDPRTGALVVHVS